MKAESKHRDSAAEQDAHYRIGEVVALSGVSRDMVKYYLRAGLLPRPMKPRANLSLYGDNHLALINLVKRFQQQTKLSLDDIATLFKTADHEPATIELDLLSRGHAADDGTILPFEASTDSPVTGTGMQLPEAFLAAAREHGLLREGDTLNDDEEHIAGLLWAAHCEGVPLTFFEAAQTQLEALAELEVKALLAIPRPQLPFDTVVESITHLDRVINRWLISTKTQHARSRFSRILDSAEAALSGVQDAVYTPSEVFCQRHGVAAQLQTLRTELRRHPQDIELHLKACQASLLLAQFDLTLEAAAHIAQLSPEHPLALAYTCLAFGMNSDLDSALAVVLRLEQCNSHHPVAIQARLFTRLLQAARLSGVSDTSQMLKDGADLFREPVTFDQSMLSDTFEAQLLHARANTLFSDVFDAQALAVDQLKTLLDQLEHCDDAALPLPALRPVYQVYTHFYLAQLHDLLEEPTTARVHYESVIRLDPASNFGERAYLKLG